ncbi:MAG: radical SAM protein [Nitrospiraceae bacterium]|nr:radical SAM protein [Nitrospiraceae bacterium]
MRPEPSEPLVRETNCKTILNKSKLGDYSLNCYGGCTHGCVYCYARYMERFHPHEEPWGAFVDVKVNAVETLERQLRSAKPGSVFVSSACDGWQPIERERELTRNCCRLLVEHGFRPNCLTKNTLILRDLDVLAGHDARVAVTITTLDPAAATLWEPHASRIEERFHVLREAHAAGLETGIMFGPVLPFLSDDQASIDAFFERAAEVKVDAIWVDALNARPEVWPSVKILLERHHPDLVERYQRVLYWDRVRTAYRRGLRERVLRAAERYHLESRVSVISA